MQASPHPRNLSHGIPSRKCCGPPLLRTGSRGSWQGESRRHCMLPFSNTRPPVPGSLPRHAANIDCCIQTGLTIVVAQGTMIITSLLAAYAGRSSGWRGYWLVNLVSFVSLPIRCAIAGSLIESWAVWPVQVIDGIGAGLQSVSTPAIVARILGETGRVNIGLGAVMTLQNAGAALSNVFAGWVAEAQGYNVALYVLGVFPVVSVALWIGFFPVLAKSGIFRS